MSWIKDDIDGLWHKKVSSSAYTSGALMFRCACGSHIDATTTLPFSKDPPGETWEACSTCLKIRNEQLDQLSKEIEKWR